LLENAGHTLLCLPQYSPDLNPIEKTFGALKTNWKNAPNDMPLDKLFV
jgi:transposase